MEIQYIDNIASTHQWLLENVKLKKIYPPYALYAGEQYDGVGSRGNTWSGNRGNLFFSFCVEEKQLPNDLPPSSVSIYFAWIMREVLFSKGSKIWLKWPNDFYLENKKIGGVITAKVGSVLIGSMGINIASCPEEFDILDIKESPKSLVDAYISELSKKNSWKQIFSKYKIEFQNSRHFSFHMDGKKVSLADAILCEDGSIEIENKKVYSLR